MENQQLNSVEQMHNGEKRHFHPPIASLSPANLFAAVTCVSFVLSIPLAVIFEGHILREIVSSSITNNGNETGSTLKTITGHIVISGLFHYLNNEIMYIVLNDVHPITLAVGNTMKRIFIIVAGLLVFSTPITLQTAFGSTIGIGGVFLYSMAKQYYSNKPAVCKVQMSQHGQ